jgi:predicted RND superfamily exporter protein
MASKAELQKAAMADVRAGKPRQEVFEAYRSQVSPEKHLAFSIASVADPERMRQGAKLNNILFGLLVFAAVTKAITGLMMGSMLMLVLGLLVPVAFAIGVRKVDGQIYPLLMLLAGLGAVTSLLKMTDEGAWMLLDVALLGIIGGLAFQVQRIIFPNINWFAVRKDAQGNYLW